MQIFEGVLSVGFRPLYYLLSSTISNIRKSREGITMNLHLLITEIQQFLRFSHDRLINFFFFLFCLIILKQIPDYCAFEHLFSFQQFTSGYV